MSLRRSDLTRIEALAQDLEPTPKIDLCGHVSCLASWLDSKRLADQGVLVATILPALLKSLREANLRLAIEVHTCDELRAANTELALKVERLMARITMMESGGSTNPR